MNENLKLLFKVKVDNQANPNFSFKVQSLEWWEEKALCIYPYNNSTVFHELENSEIFLSPLFNYKSSNFLKNDLSTGQWWHSPSIPALGKQKASLVYTEFQRTTQRNPVKTKHFHLKQHFHSALKFRTYWTKRKVRLMVNQQFLMLVKLQRNSLFRL